MNGRTVTINNRVLSLSNLDKEFYPSCGFTKTRVLEYYSRIARSILPFLEGRALTLKCYPDGVNGDFYFMKHCPRHRPSWMETADVPYGDKKMITCCVVNNLESLIWAENLASIELHVPLAKADSPGNPDSVVFDLDPGEGVDVLACARVALIIKELLSDQKLACWVKTSGKKGVHVYAPLDSRVTKFEDTKIFSKAVAAILQKNYPDLITTKMDKKHRTDKIFVNWSQNDASRTMVCAYSLRARETPSVSFPFSWSDLEKLVKRGDPDNFQVLAAEATKTAENQRDFLREMLTLKQRLPNT